MTCYQWLGYADEEWRPAHVFVHGGTQALCNRAKRPTSPVYTTGDNPAVKLCGICRRSLENALDFAEVQAS